MQQWQLNLKNQDLKCIYENYIFRTDAILKYYLACVAFNKYTVFLDNELSIEIRASENFHEVATSIRQLKDIKALRDSGEFSQLFISQSILSLITAFTDVFHEVMRLLDIPEKDVKKSVNVNNHGVNVEIKTAPLKIASYICKKYNLDAVMTKPPSMIHINCLINIRHMFIHEQGKFKDAYKSFMCGPFSSLKHDEVIKFDENAFDSYFWYLNSHLKPFIKNLDTKLTECD